MENLIEMSTTRSMILGALVGCFLLTAFTFSSLFNWTINEDYEVRFKGGGAEGTFSDLKGTIQFDPTNLAGSKMDVSVAVNTISTGNTTKDKHAKGKSWFHAEQYPEIRFTSKSFQTAKEGYEVSGDLVLHGETKTITIPFTFEENEAGGLFKGTFSLNRKDYGIKGPIMGIMVGSEFQVDLKVPVSK